MEFVEPILKKLKKETADFQAWNNENLYFRNDEILTLNEFNKNTDIRSGLSSAC